MQLVKPIMLSKKALSIKTCFSVLCLLCIAGVHAQENSPYSRYGIGNLSPNTNIVNRSMGGISAAYSDILSVNFNNPASYSSFQTIVEQRSQRPASGRVVFDVGLNYDNKTIREPNNPVKFGTSNVFFSYVQLGIPLKKNWGLSFGLRPVSRIAYKINRRERLTDPFSGQLMDSAITQFNGEGGTFLPTIGTGYKIKNLSLGANVGYFFGKKEFTTQRTLLDSVAKFSAGFNNNTFFGSVFFSGGAQYEIRLKKDSSQILRLGASGNMRQNLSATQDLYSQSIGNSVDTVFSQTSNRGNVVYPTSYTVGAIYEHRVGRNGSFMIGTDVIQTRWSEFRYFDNKDSVQDNWQVRVGTQFRPNAKAGSGYFNSVTYRAGFFFGPDYIRVGNKIPIYGVSFGLGLPIANYNRMAPGQFTLLNLAFEYENRGNNRNIIKENTFRISAGFNFSDLWFSKRRYD